MDPSEIFKIHINPGIEGLTLILYYFYILGQLFTHKFKVTMASKISTGKD